jgi:hypothetical protein
MSNANNIGCTQGRPVAKQQLGTCWINAIFNIFLLSDIGSRLVFTLIQRQGSHLTNKNGVLGAFSRQTCLFSGGPVSLNRRSMNIQLLSAIQSAKPVCPNPPPNSRVYSYIGTRNGRQYNEIIGARGASDMRRAAMRFLLAIGFTPNTAGQPIGPAGYYFAYDGTQSPPANTAIVLDVRPSEAPSFLSSTFNAVRELVYPSPGPSMRGYTLFGAVIIAKRERGGIHTSHALAGFKCGRSSYIVDSNYDLDPIRCRWWIPTELQAALEKISEPYIKGDGIQSFYVLKEIASTFYINNQYLSELSQVVCARRNNSYNNSPPAPARSEKIRQKAKNNRNKSKPPTARGGVGKPVISRNTPRTNAPPNNNNNNRPRPRPGLKLKTRPRNNGNMEL